MIAHMISSWATEAATPEVGQLRENVSPVLIRGRCQRHKAAPFAIMQ